MEYIKKFESGLDFSLLLENEGDLHLLSDTALFLIEDLEELSHFYGYSLELGVIDHNGIEVKFKKEVRK